jgi:prevent-host-death family protein
MPGAASHPETTLCLPNGYHIAIFRIMGEHSVAEAKNNLSELIDRALEGEGVVITRHGRPVVELRPIPPAVKPVTSEAIDWLRQRRVGRRAPREDSVTAVRKIRDEWA